MDMIYGTILVIGLGIFLMGTHYLLWRVGIFRGRKADRMWRSTPTKTAGSSGAGRYVILDDDDESDEDGSDTFEWAPWK